MKKLLTVIGIVIVTLFFFFSEEKVEHKLAICTIFKDEGAQLKEWIDYHHEVMRVKLFYLYNNNSRDNYQEVLKPYIKEGLIEIIDWASIKEHGIFGIDDCQLTPYQIGAYRDCLKNRAKKKADWVAMIDINEYIVPAEGVENFYTLLNDEKKKKTGSLRIYWKVFGTSNVYSLQEGERLTDKLIYRASEECDWNKQIKSIHRPVAAARKCLVHEALKLKQGFTIKTLPKEVCRIHHYWTGTIEMCEKKRSLNPDTKEELLNTLNAIEDRSIHELISPS
jgi:hypothetical protein